MRRYPSFPLALAAALLGAAACSPENQPPPIQNRITLESFSDCGALEKYIEDTAVAQMRSTLDSYVTGDWSRGGGPPVLAGDASNQTKGSQPASYTKTNTQVAGVDEADFVKNDGTRIFVLSGRKLYAATSWPPDAMAMASSLPIEGWPSQMFLDEKNRVVVLSGVNAKRIDQVEDCLGWECGWYYANTTKVTVIDVSNLKAMKVSAEHYLPGHINQSRRIGSSVRLVISDWFHWPVGMKWYPDYDPNRPNLWQDKQAFAAAVEVLKAQNESLIRAQKLSDWLPPDQRRTDDGQLVDVGYSCGDFYHANAPVKMGMVAVVTLNLDKPKDNPARTAIMAEPGEIYASTKSLYLASRHWWWWPQIGQSDHTYVHKFDITNPDKAPYVASGGIPGHIADQFSMDEHSSDDKKPGWFRVATTIATRVPDGNNTWGRIQTTNRVFVVGENAGALSIVGQSEELAPGERITSARFQGNKGYVVTFRNIDPLFTFDMSNPTHPRRVGELKVPGFSSYIHPLDEGHLLTIGTYLPEPDQNGQVDWSQRHVQLSVFDVTDLSKPSQMYTHRVGTAHGYSEAQWEHKAFNWFPERKLLAVPFSDYSWTSSGDYWTNFVSEVRVFNVDLKTGIKPLGAVSMKDVYVNYGDHSWSWYWSPWVRRSVMAADQSGNEFVYAISDGGIRVAAIGAMGQPLATVLFDKAQSTK